MRTDLFVSEIFGPTIQGEGANAGVRCGFVRLALCNLDCAWCDTPYTWDWTGKNGRAYDRRREIATMTVPAIVEEVAAMGVDVLVVSGGEPLLQSGALGLLIDALPPSMWVEIETNGTRQPGDALKFGRPGWFNVSPKLAHSGVDRQRAWRFDVLKTFAALDDDPGASFKFVCQVERDLAEVDEIVGALHLEAGRVWIMPEGRTVAELEKHAQAVASGAIARGFNLTGRLQVTLWGTSRGH